jgi:hypothetical protein
VADAGALDLVATQLVAGQLREEVGQRVATDLAEPLGRELQPTLGVVDETGVLELLGELRELLEAAGGIVAQQLAGPVQVHLGQRAGARRPAQHLLQLVEVAELVEHLRGLGEAERVLAGEVVAPVPAHLREELLEVAAQLVHLPAQVHVLEQRLGQALQLRPLLRRHRVEHRLHRGHPLGHELEQLVEGLGVLREEVAVALHELLEGGLRVLAGLLQREQLVELGQHVLHAGHRLGVRVGHRAGHLVEVALRQLLAELVHQLVEPLAGLAGRELVLLELAHHPRQVGREHVELQVPLGHHLVGDLLPALVARLARLGREVVETRPLGVDDLAQRLGDLLVDAPEVVLLELVPPAPPQALHEVAHAHHLLAVAVAEALLHQAAQRSVEVPVVQQVVGDLLEDRLGVEVEAHLGPVPS